MRLYRERHAGAPPITVGTSHGREMMLVAQQAPAASMLPGIVPVTPQAAERA